jgi:hypothetical protein
MRIGVKARQVTYRYIEVPVFVVVGVLLGSMYLLCQRVRCVIYHAECKYETDAPDCLRCGKEK